MVTKSGCESKGTIGNALGISVDVENTSSSSSWGTKRLPAKLLCIVSDNSVKFKNVFTCTFSLSLRLDKKICLEC